MIYSLRYGIYDSSLQQSWRVYDAVSNASLYLLRYLLTSLLVFLLLLLIAPLMLVLIGISSFFGLLIRATPPNYLVKDLTPAGYRKLMKAHERMETIHARLIKQDDKNLPMLLRFLHRAFILDLSANAAHRTKVMAALDQKLAGKDGQAFKSVDHKDLWTRRAKVYDYKF